MTLKDACSIELKNTSHLVRLLNVLLAEEAGIELTDAEETGTTFEENAFIKAESGCRESGMPCIADDSGIAVDYLDGAPGVYSARYAGENSSDAENTEKLLSELEKIGDEERSAKFVCAICAVRPDGERIFVRGESEGVILKEQKGEGGFGYDPVFYVEKFGKTFAELTADEKNSISHRGEAFKKLCQKLQICE